MGYAVGYTSRYMSLHTCINSIIRMDQSDCSKVVDG